MITKDSTMTSGGSGIMATRGQSAFMDRPKSTSSFTLVVAWALVAVPLAWGLYEATRVAAQLISAIGSK
jgi:hypothetical protein